MCMLLDTLSDSITDEPHICLCLLTMGHCTQPSCLLPDDMALDTKTVSSSLALTVRLDDLLIYTWFGKQREILEIMKGDTPVNV